MHRDPAAAAAGSRFAGACAGRGAMRRRAGCEIVAAVVIVVDVYTMGGEAARGGERGKCFGVSGLGRVKCV